MMQAMQTLASICMVLSASVALVLLYTAIVIHCDQKQQSPEYCFRLVFTCAPARLCPLACLSKCCTPAAIPWARMQYPCLWLGLQVISLGRLAFIACCGVLSRLHSVLKHQEALGPDQVWGNPIAEFSESAARSGITVLIMPSHLRGWAITVRCSQQGPSNASMLVCMIIWNVLLTFLSTCRTHLRA